MSNEQCIKNEQLIGIYEQCNEHLREGDRKRDQVLLFFATLLGVLISNIDKIKFDFFSDSQNEFFLTIIFGLFFVIGVILSRVLINYRLYKQSDRN